MSTNTNDDIFFLSHEYYSSEYLDAVVNKINAYREYCTAFGKFTKWQRSTQNYFGISTDGTKSSNTVTRGGDNGEIVLGKVADYRNLIQHQLILITSQRPAGVAKAINSDPQSLHQSRIGTSLVEYYLSQVGFERAFVNGAEMQLVNDESFIVLDWNATVGKEVRPNPETGEMIREGEPEIRTIAPWDMVRDTGMSRPDDMKWGIYSFRVNKFDLAKKFPQYSEKIINTMKTKPIKEIPFRPLSDLQTGASDYIEVFIVSADKTASVEQGRWSMIIPEAVLADGPFPYPEFNIYRMAQNDVMNSPFGYSNNNDILALEEITDAMNSIIITNQMTFGVQALVGPKGSGLDYTQIGAGLAYFELDPAVIDKLKPLNFTQTAKEVFAYQETLSRKKETIAGINSVVRGDPEGALRSNSGSALALVQAQSIQFNSGGQRAYYHCLSKACTGLIQMLRMYSNTERVIQITGKVQSQYMQDFRFNGDDLSRISTVTFELTNPVTQTVGGNMTIAKDLLDKGMIKNARQYITVCRTGSLDAFTEDDEADEVGIKTENQHLREGKPVRMVATENHQEHIEGHMSLLTPEAKINDPQLVQRTLAHIQEHTDMWVQLSMTNPALLIATKQQVLPPPPMPGMPGMPPAPPPEAGGGEGNGGKVMNAQPPSVQKADEVRQPQMPVNPATGERAPVPAP